jgi:hypothetical protein
MNQFFQKLSAEWSLRIGLGAMYLYSGYDIFTNPRDWYGALGALPQFLQEMLVRPLGMDNFLKVQGLGEIALGVLFLGWFFPRWTLKLAAAISVLEMAAILVMIGIDSITFRDIGLLGASLALLIIAYKKNAKN